MKKITIIGAGPGGLTAAMLLGLAGEVDIYEKESFAGGRTSPIQLGDL